MAAPVTVAAMADRARACRVCGRRGGAIRATSPCGRGVVRLRRARRAYRPACRLRRTDRVAVFLGLHAPRRAWRGNEQTYYGLFNLFVLSMLAVPMLANVALMWIAVELTTLLSAFLVGFEDTPEALEAAWKYVVLTTLGAVLALLGFLILYWGSRIAGVEPFTWAGLVAAAPHMPPALLWPAFLFILVGFGTKVGLVPMHTWLPDAHSQAPAPICALLSGVETTTVLYVILRLFPVVGAAPGLDARPWFVGLGLFSVAVATLLLHLCARLQALFAFSTVEHMGIILFAAGLGGSRGASRRRLSDDRPRDCKIVLLLRRRSRRHDRWHAGDRRGPRACSHIAARRRWRSSPARSRSPARRHSPSLSASSDPQAREWRAVNMSLSGCSRCSSSIAFCAVMRHVNGMAFGPADGAAVPVATPLSCKLTLALAAIPLVVIGIYGSRSPLRALLHAAAAAIGG